MRTATTIAMLLAISFGATAASAARRPHVAAVAAKVTSRFQALDTNNNRSLDTAEWAATSAPPNSFGFVDLNDNGNIGLHELIRVTVARLVAKRR